MIFTRTHFLGCLFIFFITFELLAQDISVKYNKNEIALNEYFTITLTVSNERLKDYSGFPEIPGFAKRGTSSSSSTTFTNGRMASSQSITQNYQASKEGNFKLKPFTMKVNGQNVNVTGTNIKVGPARQQQRRRDPFGDPFDFFRNDRQQPQEFVDVEADAFLALSTDKPEVYIGEGFTTTLAFYVAKTNKANMRFYDLSGQLTEIVKKIKPTGTWEESFEIENVSGEPVTINGKAYDQYKIYQAAFYPLNLQEIRFPSVDLKMIKYKVAKNPTFFGRNRQEDFETFSSRPKVVKVKALPPHPLKDRVAVGNYRLAEKISALELKTGESFNYTFNVIGEGNISAIEKPTPPENEHFDIYAPNVKQDITRANGKVRGTKRFDYYGIPNEPGEYHLGDYFQWIFFNTKKDQYDTLQSRQTVVVSGESRKNEYIRSNDMGSFYDGIAFENNELVSSNGIDWTRIFVNILIVAMFAASVVLVVRK